jgi:hypothetical protein
MRVSSSLLPLLLESLLKGRPSEDSREGRVTVVMDDACACTGSTAPLCPAAPETAAGDPLLTAAAEAPPPARRAVRAAASAAVAL